MHATMNNRNAPTETEKELRRFEAVTAADVAERLALFIVAIATVALVIAPIAGLARGLLAHLQLLH
jgi:hypothetical protein